MKCATMTVLCLALIAVMVVNALAASPDIAKWKKTYTDAMARIEADYQAGTKNIPKEYAQALTGLRKKTQAAGNLDELLAVKGELERYLKQGTLPEQTMASQPRELVAIQEKFIAAGSEYEAAKCKQIVELTDRYVGSLKPLKTQLTKKGEIDAALAVDAEIKRVEALPNVVAAREVALQKTEVAVKEPVAVEKKPERITKPIRSGGTTIYPAGMKPEEVEGLGFQRLRMRRTKCAPMNTPFSVALYKGMKRTSNTSSTLKSISEKTYLRLELSTRSSKLVETDTMAIVEIFSKQATGGGKIKPTRIAKKRVKLSVISHDRFFVDVAPFTITSLKTSSSSSGSKFYGVIVSLYNKEGSLAYQGASATPLKELAVVETDVDGRNLLARLERARETSEKARVAYSKDIANLALREIYEAALKTVSMLQSQYSEINSGAEPR